MRDFGEPAIIAGLTEHVRDQYAIPKGSVFIAGLSAGGAMAAILAQTYPELYEAIGVHWDWPTARPMIMSAFTAMRGQVGIEQRPERHGRKGREANPRMIVSLRKTRKRFLGHAVPLNGRCEGCVAAHSEAEPEKAKQLHAFATNERTGTGT